MEFTSPSLLTRVLFVIWNICLVGILKRWQLIFYGTATNPVRVKNIPTPSQPIPFAIQQPQARSNNFPYSNSYLPSGSISDIINQQGFKNIPEIFASGSEPEVKLVKRIAYTMGCGEDSMMVFFSQGSVISFPNDRPRPLQIARSMEGRRILHDCDPECDDHGCYGKGPTRCVSCKRYKLDK